VLHYRSDSAEAHYLLSKVHQGLGENALRQQELGESIKLDPTFLTGRLELARILISTGSADSALKLLDEAPQDQKETVGVLVQRNWALLALGQKAEARKGIDQVLAAVKNPEALIEDAALKLDQKDYAGARASAEASLSQNPDDVRALYVLVQTYAAQNQLPAGVQKVRELAAKRPSSAATQQYLGQLLASTGDRAGARKAFEAAEAAKPGLVSAELALAEMDTSEAKWDQAQKRLTGVIASQPANVPAHLLFGQLEMTQSKPAAAIEQFRKAVALDDRNVYALNALAYLLAQNQQPDEALKYAQEAKELAPDNSAVDDTLGWTYFQKGMYSLAVTHLQDATAKEGTAVRKYHLAMAYLKAGDPKRGRLMLDAALKMDPNLPEAQVARQAFGN
jgi:tetratricopeptide (TPR) repeat protein